MRLVIKLAPPWHETAVTDSEALAFTHAELAVRLSTTVLGDRFTAPARPGEVLRTIDLVSVTGWPVHVVEREAAAAREIELRYALFEFGGSVLVAGPADVIAKQFDELVEIGRSATPEWSREPVSIKDMVAPPR